MGPWEKYGGTTASAAGPWSKYAAPKDDTHGMLGEEWENNPITETIGEAAYNLPGSTYHLLKNTATAIANPIDTATSLYELGPSGILQFYKDRYGSLEAGVETFKKDPAGVLADLSTVATLGGGAAARAPGMAGQIASTASKVGAVTDPVLLAAKGAAAAAPKVASAATRLGTGAGNLAGKLAGVTTSTGPDVIRGAAKAGYESTQGNIGPATALKQHMYGAERTGDKTVGRANLAVKRMKKGAGQTLEREVAPALADKTIVPWDRVTDAIKNAIEEVSVRSPTSGRLIGSRGNTNLSAIRTMTKIATEYKKLPRAEHTIATFDGMRKQMWKVADGFQKGSTERRAAMKVYNGVVKAIRETDPTGVYRAANEKFSKRINRIKEIEKTLSLGDRFTTTDTALRKLHSVTRDTAWSNMGQRASLVKDIVDAGANNLMYELAGQTLRPLFKNNLVTAGLGGAGLMAAMFNPYSLFVLATVSPKLVGQAALTTGQAAGGIARATVATQRVLTKYGLDPMRRAATAAGTNLGTVGRGVGQVSMQTGRLSEANEQKKTLRNALGKQAEASGVKIRGNVLDNLVDDLFADDPTAYLEGIQRISKNKRLMALVMAAGEGG